MKKYNFAVVGCTGMVGRKFLEVMEERNLPIKNLYLFASKKSAGSTLPFEGKNYTVMELTDENIAKQPIDIALFSAGGSVSKEFAPKFAARGTVVIDNSSYWRMDPNVPLVIPEVNPEDVKNHHNIIANPNCSTIQAIVALKPLHDKFRIKRIVYSTYQACSGAGVGGLNDLTEGAKGAAPAKFPNPIYDNCLPQIDVFTDSGYTKEEEKMINETRKILHEPDLRVTATTVRVPVTNSHSESINVEFEKPITAFDAKETLFNDGVGVVLQDDPEHNVYPMAVNATGSDAVFVGRVRQDYSVENGINMWVVSDNIRKGAATNAVQIAQLLIDTWEDSSN